MDSSGGNDSSSPANAPAASTACGIPPSQATENAVSAYDWPTFQHDSARTGQVLMPAPYTNHELGNGQVRGAADESATTGGNLLYVEGASLLYADNSSTFAQVWVYAFTGMTQISTSATYSGGSLYVGTTTGNLFSVSASTGTLNWMFPQWGSVGPIYSNPVVDSGMVIFGSDGGNVYAVSASTGALVWSFHTNAMVRSSPSVYKGMIAVGSFDDNLYFINENTGSEAHAYTTGGAVESSPAFVNGVVYVGSDDHSVYAVNSATGKLVWKYSTKAAVTASPSVDPSGNVYVGSQDGHVYALSASGSLLWKKSIGTSIVLSGALGEGVYKTISAPFVELYYVPNSAGTLYALEADDGRVTWTLSNFTATDSPSLAFTKLYVGDSSGEIHQVGSLRFATPVGTFTTGGVAQSTFPTSQPIVVGANAAWGKMGIRGYIVNVTVSTGKSPPPTICDAQMIFTPGTTPLYNLYYTIPGGALQPGSYKIKVAIEDAQPKIGSANPRCCGWVFFKTNITVTA